MTIPTTFADLHRGPGGFILPNAWDAGSARLLEAAGFAAIATTSGGVAFSMARQDYELTAPRFGVTRDEMMARVRVVVAAVRVPVNADLEAGYGDDPETVAETIRMAIDAGCAGANIEDRRPLAPALYDEDLATARIAAAAEVVAKSGAPFVLTARSDAIGFDPGGVDAAIRRSNRYLAAGAGCAFTPGAADLPTIRRLVAGIEGPLNMVLGLGSQDGNAHEWIGSGVRRVSLGGTLARASLGFLRDAAAELRDAGSIGFAAGQIPHAELNGIFGA